MTTCQTYCQLYSPHAMLPKATTPMGRWTVDGQGKKGQRYHQSSNWRRPCGIPIIPREMKKKKKKKKKKKTISYPWKNETTLYIVLKQPWGLNSFVTLLCAMQNTLEESTAVQGLRPA